eukprot:2886219-Amphidinium_carterae.2
MAALQLAKEVAKLSGIFLLEELVASGTRNMWHVAAQQWYKSKAQEILLGKAMLGRAAKQAQTICWLHSQQSQTVSLNACSF